MLADNLMQKKTSALRNITEETDKGCKKAAEVKSDIECTEGYMCFYSRIGKCFAMHPIEKVR